MPRIVGRLLLALCLIASPAIAQAGEATKALQQIVKTFRTGNEQKSRENVTEGSVYLFEHYWQYDLHKMLPDRLQYLSERKEGEFTYVRTGTPMNGKVSSSETAMKREDGLWKLDIPETLHHGMGDGWEQKLSNAETMYVMMKSQFGDQIKPEMLRDLLLKKQ